MSFWKTLAKIAIPVGAAVAAPFTGGGSLGLLGLVIQLLQLLQQCRGLRLAGAGSYFRRFFVARYFRRHTVPSRLYFFQRITRGQQAGEDAGQMALPVSGGHNRRLFRRVC